MNNNVGSSTAASVISSKGHPTADGALPLPEKQVTVTLPPSSLESARKISIKELHKSNSLFIPAEKVNQLVMALGLNDPKQLLPYLIEVATLFSRPPISNYRVGEAGLGKSGNVYLGVNVEFRNCPLSYAIHGEQCLITIARIHGEEEVVAMALPAEPCGHCRQFMNEIGGKIDIEFFIPNSPPTNLSTLLPQSFGPKNLGIEGGLLTRSPEFRSSHDVPLVAKAIEAAYDSYAPHSKSPSGVAVRTKDGTIYKGSYLENAAFNPSLPPLQYALVALIADGRQYDEIQEVVLVELSDRTTNQDVITKDLLSKISPQAELKAIIVDSFQ